jgi:hypothetical protein
VQPDSELLKDQNLYLFKVAREDGSFLLQPPKKANEGTPPMENIAVLNKGDTAILSEIAHFCTFEAYSASAQWTPLANGITAIDKTTFLLVDVILYGPKRCLQDVGNILDEKKVFLQEPDYHDANLDYINPHLLDLSSVHPDPQIDLIQSRFSFLQSGVDFQDDLFGQIATPQSLLKESIATAFKNTTRAQNLKRIPADIRVRTSLKT